ncbi:MAG: biotin--[acetyl-CoA-carboxylase] ligase [Lachnospiraceae bacterium]|nr:biotin--[acetyl-CoA-carboxylase] ligase [Lachnospiraceae bacterium]
MKLDLKTKTIGNAYLWMEEIDSTNEELKRQAAAGAVHGTVLAAGYQTNGKGRRGRTWDSPKGDNIYLSILLRPDLQPAEASMLTLIGALAVADSIKETTGADCQIKWPNDLVLAGKKVCGILTEMSTGADGIQYVIVGIGINVNRSIFPEDIAHMASSIEKGQGREAIIASLLFHFEEKYDKFLKYKNLAPFVEEYNERLAGIGRQVQILSGGEGVIRTSHGIDEGGALIVTDEEGKEEKIISGEVSVRGLYGYV